MPNLLALIATLVLGLHRAPTAPPEGAFETTATGFIIDNGHPRRPGDSRTIDLRVRVALDPATGEAEIQFTPIDPQSRSPATYFCRRTRTFQTDASGAEQLARPFGDLSPATIAALHPALVEVALRERPENTAPLAPPTRGKESSGYFAWNDEMWSITRSDGGELASLSRRTHHDVHGGGLEQIRYSDRTVTISLRGREIARLEFAPPTPIERVRTAKGVNDRDRVWLAPPEEIVFREIADHLFAVEMLSTDSRVFIAEFADHLVVFEGAYTSRTCDLIAATVQDRFKKPVKYFAFSHIHGLYAGGVRSWVQQGATILVPPTTEPIIREIAAADFTLRPDALLADPRPPIIETVPDLWNHEDATSSMIVFNDKRSEHTDEYFIVYFPRTRTLLTGDLLFYRPGQPLTGRSRTLVEVVAGLGLEVDKAFTTWPLATLGVKNEVTGEELRAAMAAAPPGTAAGK